MLGQKEAQMRGSERIGTEHLLLGLIAAGEITELEALGIKAVRLRQELEEIAGPPGKPIQDDLPLTPGARRAMDLAAEEAKNLDHDEVGPGHMLLGLVREGDGEAAQVLARRGASVARFRGEISRNNGAIFRNFSVKARQAVMNAQKEAQMRRSKYISPEHLLLGVTDIGKADLKALGINPDDLRQHIVGIIGPVVETRSYQIPWAPDAKSALRLSALEARRLGQPVRPGHLLLGLIGVDGTPLTPAARILASRGVTTDGIRRQLIRQT
jgi:ATP-dependent Clp protease ATP-binding subunit ClpA